jgi:hypothetical protein
MDGIQKGLYDSDQKLMQLIQQLSTKINNGTLTIVRQDNVAIQINTHEKLLESKENV